MYVARSTPEERKRLAYTPNLPYVNPIPIIGGLNDPIMLAFELLRIFSQSSYILRRPQKVEKGSQFYLTYVVSSKKVGRFFVKHAPKGSRSN